MKKMKWLAVAFACILLLGSCKTQHKPGCLSLNAIVEMVKK